jgi:peptide/nickel transport system substrate-binding protein
MAEITELVSGAAHMALGARVEQAVELAKDSAFQLVQRGSRQYGFVGWNGKRAPFQDARVRRAFTMAMNRQRMIDLLRAGYGSIANGPVGRYHWAYAADLAPLPYAPDSAHALLRSAGIEDRNGDGNLDRPDGRPLIIELKFPASSTFNKDLAELVRSDLQAIGVRMEIRPTEYGVLVSDITARERRFDAVLLGWESDLRLALRSTFHSAARNGPFQFASYSNPAVDSIIDRTATMTDRSRALPELHRLQQILRDEQPWSFLYFYPDVYIASGSLRDADMDIRGALVNVTRWWLQSSAAGAGAK